MEREIQGERERKRERDLGHAVADELVHAHPAVPVVQPHLRDHAIMVWLVILVSSSYENGLVDQLRIIFVF